MLNSGFRLEEALNRAWIALEKDILLVTIIYENSQTLIGYTKSLAILQLPDSVRY
jgi:hypothetical protein